ncbi:aspartyl protease family protein At5g10770-like [Papaver somniferum]|uniref:aspartyl protease family protein At5g10770-like n=1 Tax=Papaver somniferum TaxID=3469 RepID=UPI000E6FDFA1|nr:aspartyl protease family protein At5g10770-like [Papaver somniferum]
MSPMIITFIIFVVFSLVDVSGATNHHNISNISNTEKHSGVSFKLVLGRRNFTSQLPPLSKEFFVYNLLYHPSTDYYTTVDIGTPPQSMELHIDTGSPYSWVRCQPCDIDTCLQVSFFHEDNSTSYAKVACEACNRPGKCNEEEQCVFDMKYLDESGATLVMGSETFTMDQDDNDDDGFIESKQDIIDVPLGCAKGTEGFPFLDGSLGLNMGKLSFYTALKNNYGVRMFSYCLLVRIKDGDDSSDMLFGDQVVSPDTLYTPMVHDYVSDQFVVALSEIKFKGEPLVKYTFPIKMIVDTGSTYTDLPQPVHSALLSKFLDVADQLAWGQPIRVGTRYPCYEIDPDQISASSTITFTFAGDAEIELLPHNIWRYIEGYNLACLGFGDASKTPPHELNILGNIQQQGIRIIIDQQTKGDRIGFDTSGC